MRFLSTILACALLPLSIGASSEFPAIHKTIVVAQGSRPSEQNAANAPTPTDEGPEKSSAKTSGGSEQETKRPSVQLKRSTYLLLTLSVAIGPIIIFLLFRKNRR